MFKLYVNHGKLCYRHQFLTLRKMKFARSLLYCCFNKTAAAVMAGYSPLSARYRAYHLSNDVSVLIYRQWLFEQMNFLECFPHAAIILPDDADLKERLHKCGIRVRDVDLMLIKLYHPAFNFAAMNKDEQHLMHLCVNGSYTYKKNGRTIKEVVEPINSGDD